MRIIVTPEGEPVALDDDGSWRSARARTPILPRWQAIEPTPEIVQVLSGLFHHVTVHVIDTGERILCTHHGDHIEIAQAGAGEESDFTIEIYGYQAERLAAQVEKGAIDGLQQFRIARTFMAAPQTGPNSLLRNPLISNQKLRKIIAGKSLVHVYLVSPEPQEEGDAQFSWIYVNGEWIVVPGFHGRPQRTFRLSVDDALELQRNLLKAMRSGSVSDWIRMAHWYVGWRRKVEITPVGGQ